MSIFPKCDNCQDKDAIYHFLMIGMSIRKRYCNECMSDLVVTHRKLLPKKCEGFHIKFIKR